MLLVLPLVQCSISAPCVLLSYLISEVCYECDICCQLKTFECKTISRSLSFQFSTGTKSIQSLESLLCMSCNILMILHCPETWCKTTSGLAATIYLYFRSNGVPTSRNLDFDATGQAVLKNIDTAFAFSPVCYNVRHNYFRFRSQFVLPAKGNIADIIIWRYWTGHPRKRKKAAETCQLLLPSHNSRYL